MIFKARSKSNKNCNNQAAKNKKKKTKKDDNEEDPSISVREKLTEVEHRKEDPTNVVAAGESGRSCGGEEGDGEEDLRSQTGGREEEANVPEEEGGEAMRLDGDAPAEPLASAEDTQSQTKDPVEQAEAGADGRMENGMEEEEEEGGQDEDELMGEPGGEEVCSKEIRVESSAPNPEEAQESG